ncbi:hypothetical protein AGOR_G00077110 [Albula goreensis]|uniref:Liver-expressed antimicrobial peptide 2 n=1 Tax=Albula goreensis TaxID=1534307 RepID=A0A8T3DX70_9TELE|nr:hypothetical protein AGOR_G00077110 [Albula goreensis]
MAKMSVFRLYALSVPEIPALGSRQGPWNSLSAQRSNIYQTRDIIGGTEKADLGATGEQIARAFPVGLITDIKAGTRCAITSPASAVALTETHPTQHALPSYTMQTKTYSRAAAAWALVALVLIQQVYTSPVPGGQVDSTSTHLENGGLLKRVARMTPLWRIMGSKPFGAYCKNNYECSTGICRGGHCSFSQPIRS